MINIVVGVVVAVEKLCVNFICCSNVLFCVVIEVMKPVLSVLCVLLQQTLEWVPILLSVDY